MAGGVRPESWTGVLLSTEERREVLGRLGGGVGGLSKDKRQGVYMNGDGEEGPPTATREAGPGTPGGAQGTRAEETAMVTLDATELEGGGTPSDTPEQKHGIPPLPSGGGGSFVRHCKAAERWASGFQRCHDRRNQGGGGGAPLEAGGGTKRWTTPEEEAEEVARAGTVWGGGGELH